MHSFISMPIFENIQKFSKISDNLDYRRQISKIAPKYQKRFQKILFLSALRSAGRQPDRTVYAD